MQNLIQDIRYGFRMLTKNPAFAVISVLTLALGIGANTAIFSVLNAVFLKSLPYNDPDSLVLLWGAHPSEGSVRDQLSFTDTADFRSQSSAFEDVASFGGWGALMSGAGEPEMVPTLLVSDGYFKIMRVQLSLGRIFAPEEQVDGKDNVVILSYGIWRNRFAADPGAIGRTITLDGKLHTIVGVMPPSLAPLPKRLVDEQPIQLYRPVGENYVDRERSSRHLRAIARLKPGVTLAQAQAELSAIAARIEAQHPDTNTDCSVKVVPLREDLVGYLRPALLALFAAVGFILLIACANVANLLLARAAARQRETAVRAALGAGRLRLVRQFLTESILLSLVGGLLGFFVAAWGTSVLAFLGAKALPYLSNVRADPAVLGFTFAVSLVTGMLFGIFPALRVSRPNLIEILKEGGRTSALSFARSRFRNILVISELALALVLLVAAGLLVQTLSHLRAMGPGFNPSNVLTMDISLDSHRYAKESLRVNFYSRLLDQTAALPAVRAAAMFHPLPLSGDFDQTSIEVQDHPVLPGHEPSADRYIVTPGFLDAMQIRLVRGRAFTRHDNLDSQPVIIVNETFARTFWPNQNPLGKWVRLPWEPGWKLDKKMPQRTIIGVVGDIKQFGLDTQNSPQLYVSHAQYPTSWANLVVRTKSDPAALGPEIRGVVRSLDPDEAVWGLTTFDEWLADSLALRRFTMLLLVVFAVVAVALATIGIYGVMSYLVTQRTHEIGIRVALGAQPRDVHRLVLGHGFRLVAAGTSTGVAGALICSRLLSSLLFGVTANDPHTLTSVAVFLAGVAIAACYIPARRAMRVDPVIALRYE